MVTTLDAVEQGTTETIEVSVDELIAGRTLRFPVHDRNGILLLAADSLITTDIQRNLKARGLDRIALCASDARAVTLGCMALENNGAKFQLDTELTRKLDEIIDGGKLAVVNLGQAVKERVVCLGRRPYDHRQRERLTAAHKTNENRLHDMMSHVLHGGATDGEQLKSMASGYVTELVTDTDSTLTSMIGIGDRELEANALEVALLSMAIGIETGLDAENVRDLGICALVSDWGLARIPEELRNAKRRLTPIEMIEIKKHPIHTANMLESVSRLPRMAAVAVYQVHESPNGSGYPRGRSKTSIHPFAAMIHVAKAYVALTKRRPYRPPLMRYSAMEWLVRQARDGKVDTTMVRALLQVQSLFPIGSFVTLSNGSVAQVLRRNQQDYARPIVQLLQDAKGNSVDPAVDYSRVNLGESKLTVAQALPTPGSDEIELSPEHLQ